jgi:UDP-N-acetylglucosamine transferase subunit ALG13
MVCVHISKYGNIDNHKVKIAVKYAKNQKKMKDEVGGLVALQSPTAN